MDDLAIRRWHGGSRVTAMSVNRWRRALLDERQRREPAELIEQGPAAHGHLDQRWTSRGSGS